MDAFRRKAVYKNMKEFRSDTNLNTERILKTLEKDITQYDKIILLPCQNLISELSRTLSACISNKKTLVLSTKQSAIRADNIIFRQITKDEAEFLSDFYLTYEFSDKFTVIPKESVNYPSLQNFVDTGLLSREELMELLLS